MDINNGIPLKRKFEQKNDENLDSKMILSSFDKEPQFKKPKIPPLKRSTASSSSSSSSPDDGIFKMPKLPEPKKTSNPLNILNEESISTEKSERKSPIPDSSNTPSEFKYSTEIEKNKIFVRNVDFACTEEEIKVFLKISLKLLIKKDLF